VVSDFMALFAAGSLAGWPLFRLGKNIYKRGRLPDMKPLRVAACASVIGAAVLFFFLVPLPVSRVRQQALVQVDPATSHKVYVTVPGILEELNVHEGERVRKHQVLAIFNSRDVEAQYLEAHAQYKIRVDQLLAIAPQRKGLTDKQELDRLAQTEATLKGDRDRYLAELEQLEKMRTALVLRAPMEGIVMNSPKVYEIGKLWDKSAETPFCTVGDPTNLEMVMPVTPPDYALLDYDTRALAPYHKELNVTIRVQGRDSKTWKGKLDPLPESDAREVPPQLTSKLGGPLAVKPPSKAGQYIPQAQVYLVHVHIVNPDGAIEPGSLGQVKVHCRWRSVAWWCYRKVADTFDIQLAL
jgi:hypothetical protein